jgi:GGDEF domain-containing protein
MRQVSAWIAGLVRAEDTVARCSEDEIIMFLPGTSPEAAGHVARRIAAVLRHTDLGLPGVEGPVRPWLRTGVAAYRDIESWAHIAERARITLH